VQLRGPLLLRLATGSGLTVSSVTTRLDWPLSLTIKVKLCVPEPEEATLWLKVVPDLIPVMGVLMPLVRVKLYVLVMLLTVAVNVAGLSMQTVGLTAAKPSMMGALSTIVKV